MSAAPADLQPSLFDVPPLAPIVPSPTREDGRKQTLAEAFAEFHAANAGVYVALRGLALRMKANGRQRWSINGAFEVLRWQYAMQTQGDEYKLNNNHRAFYARLLMEDPALTGFFETRGNDDEHNL